MLKLPNFDEITVTDYELFPGNPPGSGIAWSFAEGVTIVAGINGLGKTTLLTMVLRSITGPYDLSANGPLRSLNIVLPAEPVYLNAKQRRVFQNRVVDCADTAQVRLSFFVGEDLIAITRHLKDLSLAELEINGESAELPSNWQIREKEFQSRISQLLGVSNFVDVLLVLHYVVLFYENRPGALWDSNAQRQLLRTFSFNAEDSMRVVDLEREVQSADSQARNVHVQITAVEKRWREAIAQQKQEEDILKELESEQQALDSELGSAEKLDEQLQQIDSARKEARLAYERAKIAKEDANGAIERLKYTALLRLYPSMDDTVRMVLSRILTDEKCPVCNAAAGDTRREIETQIEKGHCPICGAIPADQDNIVAIQEFDKSRMDQEILKAERSSMEESKQFEQMQVSNDEYSATLTELDSIYQSIRERRERNELLLVQLGDAETIKELENTLNNLNREYSKWQHLRSQRLRDLKLLILEKAGTIEAKSNELIEAFAEVVKTLLVDETRLVPIVVEPRYTQGRALSEEQVQVPAFTVEMKSLARPTYVRRGDPNEVSESQRELIDLAFRLALVRVFSGSCTFVMETPEASLDGIAMERVGNALAAFSTQKENRLVVTSNLTNTGVISTLFEASDPYADLQARRERVLNLLDVAEPNNALNEARVRYDAMLTEAITGGVG